MKLKDKIALLNPIENHKKWDTTMYGRKIKGAKSVPKDSTSEPVMTYRDLMHAFNTIKNTSNKENIPPDSGSGPIKKKKPKKKTKRKPKRNPKKKTKKKPKKKPKKKKGVRGKTSPKIRKSAKKIENFLKAFRESGGDLKKLKKRINKTKKKRKK